MLAKLLKDNNSEREYQISTGEIITVKVDEFENTVSVYNANNEEIGSVRFRVIDNEFEEVHKLTWMYLDVISKSYKRQGIGRAAVETYKDYFDAIITAGEDDGQQHDDGSHLTGDAPRFVAKLREEGIIRKVYLGDEDDY